MVQVVNYSDESIAVIGDTKEIKEQLKELGGKFNFRLSCGAGWIFSKSKTDEVKKSLNIEPKLINGPAVYVGTYCKYNNSNLAGGWVGLFKCGTYTTFLDECKKLHSDEADPEYMIQDNEYMPDGLSCGEWISETEFNDILTAYKESLKPAESRTNDFIKCLNDFCRLNEDGDYYLKNYVGAVRLSCGILLIEKPSIENRFCFRDEGEEYEFYKSLLADKNKMEKYFLAENLKKFNSILARKENNMFVSIQDGRALVYSREYDWQGATRDADILACGDDKKLIIEAYEYGRECMQKRLDTYLKRYGTSKIETWSYWADI